VLMALCIVYKNQWLPATTVFPPGVGNSAAQSVCFVPSASLSIRFEVGYIRTAL
jgi:hypothetical protein